MAETVKVPVVPDDVKQVPPTDGLSLVPTQTPLAVILSPPSEVTFPPRVALVDAIESFVGLEIEGA